MAKNCKVITTSFVGRELRFETEMSGDPPGLFSHAQNFPDPESVLELVSLIHEFELKVDPGVECDTVIVNNDTGWEKGNRYLASLDGGRTYAGSIKVLSRGNSGTSFGGYSHAYEMFRGQYEYWTFTEDDILITGDKWLLRCIDTLSRQENPGFVAIQGLSREFALHAHGGVGTTSTAVLDAVRNVWGSLPHREPHESQSDLDHIVFGEVLFTNLIHRMGRSLTAMECDPPLYTFAYDYMRKTRGIRYRPGLVRRALRTISRLTENWAQKLA